MPALHATLVVLHVLASLVGFGAIALQGVYAGIARHPERPGARDDASRFFAARSVADLALLAVPVLGVAAVAADHPGDLSRAWVAIALVLWLVAVAVWSRVTRPARAALATALAGRDRAPVAAAGGRLAWGSAVCDVVFVVALIDMVVRPG